MEDIDDSDVPKTGAVFTYGLSRFEDNEPGKFWVRNDKVVQVSCGEEHSVLITESGRAFSFGKNEWGQLGVGKNLAVHNKPVCIKSLKTKGEKVRLVACGRNHTLLSTESGSLYGMGNNVEKQISASAGDSVLEPYLIHSGQDFMALAAGGEMSAALLSSGQILTWGSNAEGQCGIGDEDAGLDPVTEPTRVSLPGRVVSLSCGYYHAAAVLDDGRVFTWGEADGGKLGLIHVTTSQLEPQEVPVAEPIRSVSCGNNHTVAVAASGRLYVWGEGLMGQLGLGQEWDSVKEPTRVKFKMPDVCVATAVAAESHTLVLSDLGRVFVFGDDRHGKLGLHSTEPSGDSRAVWLPTEVARFRNSGIKVYGAASGGCHSVFLGVPDVDAPALSSNHRSEPSQCELTTDTSEMTSEDAPRPHARRRLRGENTSSTPTSLPSLRRPPRGGGDEDRCNNEFDDMLLDDDTDDESKRMTAPRPARRSNRSMKSVTPSPRDNEKNGADLLLSENNNPSERPYHFRNEEEDEELQPKARRRAKPGIFNKGVFDPEDEDISESFETKPILRKDSLSNAKETDNRQAEENRIPIESNSQSNSEKVSVGCGGRKSSSATNAGATTDDTQKSKSCVML